MNAAEKIRQTVGAMLETHRGRWDLYDDDKSMVVNKDYNTWTAETNNPTDADFIMMMDPVVALALADLFDAHHARAFTDETGPGFEALERAILRSET